jgi:predicted ATP-dependent protease
VGQVNGISVLSVGDHAFGRPTRITASFHVGTAGIIAIERDVKLAGPIHNKGAMILAGYLGSKYARAHPLALAATLTFEQTYEEVEGDSASSAELYAMLSALSGLPLRQDLAVTGSIDQHGRIQAIGGVNEKIEGFFDVCRVLGLTGTQGVIIPQSNARNLMLREDVVAAVGEGRFAVHAVATVEEAIELLTGKPAGESDADGRYPAGTVNDAVQRTLDDLVSRIRPYITHESGTRTSPGRG